jgi:Asp-tRNA(Asn)/Glu-tRNA(Gln) amidotransferase B subunit
VPESFSALVWSQAEAQVRGETSQDAWESRRRALDQRGLESRDSKKIVDERSRNSFYESAFSDSLAVYMLSLAVDFDYHDLRERDYPLLAAPALAERLRHVASLFPASAGYDFQILYRRKG